MEHNSVFNIAADFVNHTSCHIFLTGKAGTGKTTFLKYITQNTHKKYVVVAPTGVAAINAGGVTMHSLFQLPLGPYVPVSQASANGFTDKHALFKNMRLSEEKRRLLRDLELIIIDEVSMVRCDTLDAVDAILRYFRKKNDIPFGGVQLLYIGDLFQLPPVMPEQEWAVLNQYYESPFFFHSKAVAQAKPVYIELKKIYRQNEQHFIALLNRIRNAETIDSDFETLNARFAASPKPDERYITLTSHNHKADRINAQELQKLPGKLYEFKGTIEGDFPDKTLPTEVTLRLKEGAQVMFIRNDTSEEHRYFNGKLATVKKINTDAIIVSFADSDGELLLEKESWDNIRYSYNSSEEKIEEEKLGSFTQYPIRLAWAITIHKSQGLTFTHAIIDAGDSFAPGQVYVALSRCSSMDGLVLRSKIIPSSISTDPQVLAFANQELEADKIASLLDVEKKLFINRTLLETFDLSKLIEGIEHYMLYIPSRKMPDVKGAVANASKILSSVKELQQVVLKFQDQLTAILNAEDYDKLIERVSKAMDYFTVKIRDEALIPLDAHIQSLSGASKVKKYLKQVNLLKASVVRKIQQIQNVRYGDIIFKPTSTVTIQIQEEKDWLPVQGKAEKGSSVRETLSMFRSGIKISEIAKKRGLALGTVEGHIAQLVKSGDIGIAEVVDADKLKMIIDAIKETGAGSITPVKQALEDRVSFGEIRAVVNHLQLLKNKTPLHSDKHVPN